MAPLSFHDRQHLQKVLAQQQNITVMFNRFINAVSPHLRKWADTGKGSVWSRNGAVESVVDRELVRLQAELTNNLSSFQMDAWKRSELKNDQMIREYIEGMSIRSQIKEGLFARNTEGMQALQGRIDKDMNLSTRVWNLADQTKTQLEFYLGSGISIGQSAANISQDIRQILNNPDARFHRIRNAEGKLVESKPMMNYNPGPGVYKSASKNALRVAVTETNMAYRKADHERWLKLNFVLGFEVKRSGNNKGGCVICDAMCGTYPKEFSFTGWHPFCICMATPILMDHDEFAEYLLNDTIPMDRYVTDIPPRAVKCMEQYKYSFKRSPYDMKRNYKIFSSDGKLLEKTVPVPEAPKTKGKTKFKTDEQKAAIREAWEERRINNLPDIMPKKPIKSISDIQGVIDSYMKYYPEDANGKSIQVGKFREKPGRAGFTMMRAYSEKGIIEYNTYKALEQGMSSPFSQLLSALNKIQKKEDLKFAEEYSVECFYHEIMHCKAKQHVRLKGHGQGDYKRTAMESINQFVSRHEYGTFIERLGGKAINRQQVLDEGSGYRSWVGNLRDFIKSANIDENKAASYFKDKLLNGRYDELETVLSDYIIRYSGTKLSSHEVLRLFESRNKSDWDGFLKSINNNNQ